MHTIVLLHSWRLGLCKVYTALQVLYLQRICHSICNNATVYQLVHYERLVAGGRCFYVFSGSSSNLVVISFLFQLSSSFLILLKVVDMFAF